MLTSYTDTFANLLGIPRGCNISSYTKLYLAFLISGSFHALGQLHLPRPANISASECSLGFLLFFIWQAIAITAEDFVIWVWRNSMGKGNTKGKGMKRLNHLVGYAWVLLSMWFSLPLVGDTVLKLRVGTGSFLPFSPTKSLVEQFVSIPP